MGWVKVFGCARWVVLCYVAVSVSVGCARARNSSRGGGDGRRENTLTVFAAASLRGVFTALKPTFTHAHPGVTVTFNFAGTQTLRAQVEHGAAVDLFASADWRHMRALMAGGKVAEPIVFARNEPVMVVSREAASTVRSLADLATAQRVVLGVPEVPIGAYSLEIFARARSTLGEDFSARVEARVVSRELNVRQVLAKVSLGEAQAGIVYRTDALTARDRVTVVPIAPEVNVVAEYPAAVSRSARSPGLARAWVALLLSPTGRQALTTAGFSLPRAP